MKGFDLEKLREFTKNLGNGVHQRGPFGKRLILLSSNRPDWENERRYRHNFVPITVHTVIEDNAKDTERSGAGHS